MRLGGLLEEAARGRALGWALTSAAAAAAAAGLVLWDLVPALAAAAGLVL